jgi:hypothetical protein
MNKTILITILLLVAGLNAAFPQNTMRIDTLGSKPGDTLTYSVKVDNVKPFVAFQLDIQVPAQLTYLLNSAALTSRANGHSLAVSLINANTIRALAYSTTMTPFNGSTGAVMTFRMIILGTTPGNYNIPVVSPIISDSLNLNILTASYGGRLIIQLPKINFNTGSIDLGRTLLGTNKDFTLNISNGGTTNLIVSRLSSISTNIRFLDSSGFTLTPGTNINRTVRLYADSKGLKTATLKIYSNDPYDTVHSIPAQGTVYTTNELYLNTITLKYGFSGTIKIRMKNFEPVNAFQLSVTLPSSVNYNAGSIVLNPVRKTDHVINASILTGNVLRIISYSPTNAAYLGNDSTIAEFSIRAIGNPGGYSLPVSGGVISDTSGANILSDVFGGSVTIISPVINLPASILFDTISSLDTNRKTLAIRNNGTDTLKISGISCSNSSFVNETTLPVYILPNVTSNFTVRFSNPNRGLQTGNLIISHNDSLRNPGQVPVSGYVYKINRMAVHSSDFNSRDTSYLPFDLNNAESVVAFQFDVTLPPQAVYMPGTVMLTSRSNGHTVSASVLGNGDIRVLAYSMTMTPFSGTSGEIVKFKVAMNADTGVYIVSIKNIIISDSNNVNISNGLTNGFIRVSPLPPLLVSPANGSVGNQLNLNLLWMRSQFASGYHLQVATDSLFANKVINDSTRTDTTFSLNNLNILQNYYWRVRVKNYSGIYRFSDPWRFKTIGYPTQVVLSSPANNTVNQPLNVTFKWFKAIDQTLKPRIVSNYWFELAVDSLFTSIIARDSSLTDTLKSVSGLSNYTNYFWRVKAKNEIGWALYSPVWKFTTLPPVPSAPVLLLPANNSTGMSQTPLLDWNDVTYAENYRIQISADSLFGTTIWDTSGVVPSQVNVPAGKLASLTKYYWRINANNIAGTGIWSAVWNFKTIGTASQVVLSTPSNNAIDQSVDVLFKWFKAVDLTLEPLLVSNYWFELSADSLFTSIVLKDTLLTDTLKYTAASLNFNTSYFWRVKAKNQIGWGAFSDIWKFTTYLPVPSVPVLVSPANNSVDLALTPLLDWNDVTFASGYRVQISTSSSFTTTVYDTAGLPVSQITVPSGKLTTNTLYYWRVSASNASGTSSYSSIWNFSTAPNAPNVPVLSQPANGSTGQPTTITFVWYKAIETMQDNSGKKGNETDEIRSINKYWFEYGTDSTFTIVILRDTLLTASDTSKTISGLSNLTKYFWRVKAKNQTGWGNFSAVWNFTTLIPIPSAPALLLPANNSLGISLTPLLDWNDVQYASGYRVQVSADSLFGTTLWDTSSVVPSQVTVPSGKLTGLTKYYWRVNATNAAGTGSWSPVWNFRTVQNLTLNLKVYLEGFWDGSTHVQDTIFVYLAGTSTPFAYVDTAKAVLSATGTSPVTFTKAPNGSYHIVIVHRNHLETWSKLGQSFVTNVAVNYDFTTAATQAYGDNMKQFGSAWMFYGGDPNMDGSIDGIDIALFINEFGLQGYLSCDFNGDGDVNAMDVQIITANFGLTKSVPSLDFNTPPVRKKMQEVIKGLDKKVNKLKSKNSN